jgi:hypothetical protein
MSSPKFRNHHDNYNWRSLVVHSRVQLDQMEIHCSNRHASGLLDPQVSGRLQSDDPWSKYPGIYPTPEVSNSSKLGNTDESRANELRDSIR